MGKLREDYTTFKKHETTQQKHKHVVLMKHVTQHVTSTTS